MVKDGESSEPSFHSDSNRVVSHEDQIVNRKTGYWSPAVHELLEYLKRVGFTEAPRLVTVAPNGLEQLSYIDGVSGADAWAKIVPEAGLRSFARLVRRYHEVVKDFRPEHSVWATERRGLLPGEIITHGDFGPWNTVWHADSPVGLVDWDLAGPGKPLDDVAYALEYSAPFRSGEECVKWLRYPEPPNRAERMAVFAEAYGLPGVGGLYDAVIRRQVCTIENTRVLAEQGLEPQATWVRNGYLHELQARIEWTRNNQEMFQ